MLRAKVATQDVGTLKASQICMRLCGCWQPCRRVLVSLHSFTFIQESSIPVKPGRPVADGGVFCKKAWTTGVCKGRWVVLDSTRTVAA